MATAEEDFNMFTELSRRVCESAEEAEQFVASFMKKAGHKPVTSWTDAEESNNSGGESKKNWWEGSSESKSVRSIPRRNSGGSDWQYKNGA